MKKSLVGILCSICISSLSPSLYADTSSNSDSSSSTKEMQQDEKKDVKKTQKKKHKKHHKHKHHSHHHHKAYDNHHYRHHEHYKPYHERTMGKGNVYERDSWCRAHPNRCRQQDIEVNEELRDHR